MLNTATPRTPSFLDLNVARSDALVTQAVQNLLSRPASIAPKFFYDELGSRLFDAITALPEYYPTRTEAALLKAHGAAMAQASQAACGATPTLIDLGAGNCEKAASLFDALQPSRYVAVDISADYLRGVLARLQREHPAIELMGVGTDFSLHLELPASVATGPSLVFYPGSSIGNFAPDAALRFLRQVHGLSNGGALLIGVDLAKAPAILEPAYDDALGVTAAFNLNVLTHLNRLLGSDFDLADWKHVAFFDRDESRIEMHLEATRPAVVQFHGEARQFEAGERILTEYSYKWKRDDFEALLKQAGFTDVTTWTDERGWFAVMLAT